MGAAAKLSIKKTEFLYIENGEFFEARLPGMGIVLMQKCRKFVLDDARVRDPKNAVGMDAQTRGKYFYLSDDTDVVINSNKCLKIKSASG